MYKYNNDPEIKIGVLGMVDDTLAVSECGISSVLKNSIINSCVETQRLRFSEDKSVVIHVENAKKCSTPCPKLKVHKKEMHEANSTKYLGHIISSKGGIQETIQDRKNRGWGKVSQIQGILAEIDVGYHNFQGKKIKR